jgi:hypothetical protein
MENQKILESGAKLTLVPPGSGGLVALLAAQAVSAEPKT